LSVKTTIIEGVEMKQKFEGILKDTHWIRVDENFS